MQLEQTLRTLCALPAVSGFEMQAAKAVAELFRPYCDTVDADKNGNVIGSLSCGKEGAKNVPCFYGFKPWSGPDTRRCGCRSGSCHPR